MRSELKYIEPEWRLPRHGTANGLLFSFSALNSCFKSPMRLGFSALESELEISAYPSSLGEGGDTDRSTTMGELAVAGTSAGGEPALYSIDGGVFLCNGVSHIRPSVGVLGVPGSGTMGLLGVTNIFSYWFRYRFEMGVSGSSACERGVGMSSDSINDVPSEGVVLLRSLVPCDDHLRVCMI